MGVIHTLSGFLGLPSDWDFLPWPHRDYQPLEATADDTLVGYSMGGRRALQILESRSFARAVIISAGLNAPDEQRRARDEEWARRFEQEEWPALMAGWNQQSVFGGHSLARQERDYDRHELARMLREWSPAVLPPPHLEAIETPILWVVGERDERYLRIGEEAVARLPHASLWVCPGAGHRVPFEQPTLLVNRLRAFLELQ